MGAFSNKHLFSFSSFSDNKYSVGYGISSIFYPSKMKRSFLQIGFIYKRINDYELKVGRWKQKISSESILSTGSLIRGNNSIPIPQISLMIPNYKKYIIFNNEIWIKGGFTHGWFSKGEYIKAPYLHEKYFYIKKYFNNKSEFSLGLVHEAIWGGTTYIHGSQPGTFEDYLRVVFARPASSSGFIGEQFNVLGNHLGIWDLTYSKKNLKKEIKFYYQHPFEDKSGAFQHFFDEPLARHLDQLTRHFLVPTFLHHQHYLSKYQAYPTFLQFGSLPIYNLFRKGHLLEMINNQLSFYRRTRKWS